MRKHSLMQSLFPLSPFFGLFEEKRKPRNFLQEARERLRRRDRGLLKLRYATKKKAGSAEMARTFHKVKLSLFSLGFSGHSVAMHEGEYMCPFEKSVW